jgi:two-component system, cell cycle sensor histidine kinase and response regulator CckA
VKPEQDVQLRLAELETKCESLEKSLRESEARFSRLFNAASSPMTITTIADGRMIDVNDACLQLSGNTREELIGTLAAQRSAWADPKQRGELIQKMREEGRVHNRVTALHSKTGETHKVLFSADPVTVNDEPCLLGVLIDITEREKEAEILRKSEEKYRMLVEHSLQGLAIIREAQIIFCNSALAAMTGYSREELLSSVDSMALVHPEDRESVLNRLRDRLSGKSIPSNYEYRLVKNNGDIRWLEIHATLIEYEGETAVQVACIDITDRKQAEQVLREAKEYLNQIINCIGDAIFVMDREHKYILINDAICRFTGRQREALLGTTSPKPTSATGINSLWEQEEAVFETGKELVTEDSISDGQGNPRNLMTKKSLLTDQHGNKQIVGISRDITEYKQLQAKFMQAQKMEAIGVLAGGVAHDFNNLLNVINGYSELVLEELDGDDPIRKDLEQIQAAGRHAAALTSQLLAFSRKQILQPEILSLNTAMIQMSSMLRRMIGEDIEIVTRTQPDLGLINADPGQIQQIVMNLAVNARDAMPHGGKLTIETANVDYDADYAKDHPSVSEGAYVMMAITDNGIGMDANAKEHLFEPFFTTKGKGRGTGLGLSTIYGIVRQSNGFIWVYSEPGKGTTFKIYFPRVNVETEDANTRKDSAPVLRGSETVLVVEDEQSVRALTCRVLRDRGYTILEAADGMQALEIAGSDAGNIDMVVTDVVMPGMTGKDLVVKLQSMRPDIKVLYTSGYTDNAIVHHGILNPDVAFLQKPFTAKNLAQKVREVIDS